MALSPASATVQCQQGRPGANTATGHRQHAAVLVVGMCRRVEDARRCLQLEDLLPGPGGALVEAKGGSEGSVA
jgi:hypothetical protein